MNCARNRKLLCALLAIALLFFCTSCNGAGETVVVTCNGLSITESTFMMLLTEQALGLADQEGITEENLVEKAKEAVLDYLPAYTYYVQGYQAANYALSEEDSGQLRASALANLINSGMQYESSKKDEIFLKTFGATFEQYMDYQEEAYLISYFYQEQLKHVEVDETLSKAYFSEHQAEYAICTADILRYPNGEAGKTAATQAAAKMEAGGSLEECKLYTGWEKAETITFDNSSNLDASFGKGFVASMVLAQQGSVQVLEEEGFITVARLTTLSGYEENLEEIQKILQEDLYAEELAKTINGEAYTPKIVNQEVYDAIREIPGSEVV